MRNMRIPAIVAVALALGACQDLNVENTNAPDQARAISEAGDVESLIGSGFFTWYNLMRGCYPSWAMGVAADEGTSSWGNCGMQDISSEPRTPFPNTTGYGYRRVVQDPWYRMYDAISSVNDGLRAIADGLEIGEGGADNTRAIAWGKFVQGLAHGFLALEYDRAFIFTEDDDLETTEFTLQPYDEVMTAAIGMFDDAISTASGASFTTPTAWVNEQTYSSAEFVKIVNSYAARFMASVARTPTERAAVNWQEVLNRANNGITEDFGPILDDNVWRSTYKERYQNSTWFRLDNNLIGPADISGAWQEWLATPVADRQPFDIDTPDKRIQGGAVGEDGTDIYYRKPQNFRADRGTYHFSRYGHKRYRDIQQTQLGFNPIMTVVEMDMLKAEAYLRMNQPQMAADLINKTRTTRGGLPPVTASGVTQSADCMPRTPSGDCGDLWDALRYEKRIEGIAVAAGQAYFDARGWGTLVPGTPVHLPIPAVELETLQMPFYTFGGVGGEGAAK